MGRLRNIPGAGEVLGQSEYVIDDPAALRGRWQSVFSEERPLYAELGMGKGRFITDMARLHPEYNYIGIERYSSVLLRAVQKLNGTGDGSSFHLRLLCADAGDIAELFAPGELDGIYLNFSDPWPKDRHAKRRLTAPGFLEKYAAVVRPGGRLEFKTDNVDLFDWSLETVEASPHWQLTERTWDLHADPEMSNGNVLTEYEAKFAARGQKICKMIAVRKQEA